MRLPFRTLLLLFILLLAPAGLLGRAHSAPAQSGEQARYVVYLFGQRAGSLVSMSTDSTYQDRPATRSESELTMKLQALGAPVEQRLLMTLLSDPSGKPLWMETVLASGGRKTTYHARFTPNEVMCTVDAEGQKSEAKVPIPAGISLSADPDQSPFRKQLRVGARETIHFFEIISMSIQREDSEVVRTEERKLGGKRVLTYVLRTKNSTSGDNGETWLDGQGRLLEERSPRGIRLVREDLDGEVQLTGSEPAVDVAEATAVKTNVILPQARKTRLLRIRVTGLPDDDLVLSDARQQVVAREAAGEARAVTYLIRSRDLPHSALPPAAAGASGPGLGDAPLLGSTDNAIRKQARELAPPGADRAAIARRIRAWVKGHVQKLTNVATPRSAPEVMSSREGVCRDSATLFVALARAAGVPARVCSGMVYLGDRFYYHAWAECRLTDGEDGWYALDPTLDTDFVDATHVKFGQGDPAMMYRATRVVGHVRAEILEHQRETP